MVQATNPDTRNDRPVSETHFSVNTRAISVGLVPTIAMSRMKFALVLSAVALVILAVKRRRTGEATEE